MNKKYICIILAVVLLIGSFVTCFRAFALGDPITAYQLGAISYGIAQDAGMGFVFSHAVSSAVSSFMENQINSYLSGSTLAEKFALEQVRYVAGKLVVGQQLYNDIIDFLDYFKTGKSDGDVILPGEINGIVIDNLNQETGEFGGYTFDGGLGNDSQGKYTYFNVFSGQLNVSKSKAYYSNSWTKTFLGWQLVQRGNGYAVTSVYEARSSSTTNIQTFTTQPSFVMSGTVENQGTVNVSSYAGTPIDVGYQWQGTFGEGLDTNLDQLVGRIYEEVADTNLDVEGEVVEEQPIPTPVPTVVPGDIDGYWNRQADQLQDLGNDIGGLSEDLDNLGKDIGKEAGKVIDSVDGASEGIQDAINSQTGTVSGAIDQAISDVNDAIGEQTQSLSDSIAEQAATIDQSLTGVKEGIQDIAGKLEPEEIDEKTFDLRELFPFCIPFDIYHLLQKFDGTPIAPHVQLPFVIQSIGFSYTFDLDFSAWDPVAAALRTVELIVYALGLAWATSKVIKW